jgi:hypothetical protein
MVQFEVEPTVDVVDRTRRYVLRLPGDAGIIEAHVMRDGRIEFHAGQRDFDPGAYLRIEDAEAVQALLGRLLAEARALGPGQPATVTQDHHARAWPPGLRHPVESSAITAVGYDPDGGRLEVEFPGGSVGGVYARQIRGNPAYLYPTQAHADAGGSGGLALFRLRQHLAGALEVDGHTHDLPSEYVAATRDQSLIAEHEHVHEHADS